MYLYGPKAPKSNPSLLNSPEKSRIYFWRIKGEASNDSGGGIESVVAMTPNPWTLPDVDDALEIARPGYRWYLIDLIEQAGSMPAAFDEDNLPEAIRERLARKGVHNG